MLQMPSRLSRLPGACLPAYESRLGRARINMNYSDCAQSTGGRFRSAGIALIIRSPARHCGQCKIVRASESGATYASPMAEAPSLHICVGEVDLHAGCSRAHRPARYKAGNPCSAPQGLSSLMRVAAVHSRVHVAVGECDLSERKRA